MSYPCVVTRLVADGLLIYLSVGSIPGLTLDGSSVSLLLASVVLMQKPSCLLK